MPIQFQCSKCGQWLEVDEPNAGGKAICPFCQEVNDVPESAPQEQEEKPGPGAEKEVPPAEGTGPYTGVPTEQTRPHTPDVPVSKPVEQQKGPEQEEPSRWERDEGHFDAGWEGLPQQKTGWLVKAGPIGLALSLASVVVLLISILALVGYMPPSLRTKMVEAPSSQETVRQTQEEITAVAKEHMWIVAAIYGATALNLVGLGMSLITAITPGPHRRGSAWAGVVIGGLLFLCICSSILQQAAGMLTK